MHPLRESFPLKLRKFLRKPTADLAMACITRQIRVSIASRDRFRPTKCPSVYRRIPIFSSSLPENSRASGSLFQFPFRKRLSRSLTFHAFLRTPLFNGSLRSRPRARAPSRTRACALAIGVEGWGNSPALTSRRSSTKPIVFGSFSLVPARTCP